MARFRISLYLVLLTLFLSATSAYGQRSTIENGTLLIPRVDIEGAGTLQLIFNLAFEEETFFDLISITEASPSVDNAAIYYPDLLEIEVFEIELETGDIYAARLGFVTVVGGYRFNLLEAQLLGNSNSIPDPPPPAEDVLVLYQQQCATCHGDTGQGTVIAPSLIDCVTCSDASVLASTINDTMPQGNSSSCDKACSELLSNYILTVFNGPASDPNGNPNNDPNAEPNNDPTAEPNNDPNTEPNTGSNEDAIVLYNQQCATCHGDKGLGTDIAPSLIDCATCSDATVLTSTNSVLPSTTSVLANTINKTMPPGNSSSCNKACSELLSNYILTVFNEPASDPNGKPNSVLAAVPNNDPNTEPNTGSNEDPIALYDQLCATCHGDTGQGTDIAPSLIDCISCSDASVLARTINISMPQGNSSSCDKACSDLLSNYILTVFNEPASDSNEEPNSDSDPEPNNNPNSEPNTGSDEDPIALYDQLCATCHGDTGQGTDIAPSLIDCVTCSDASFLARTITYTMPQGNSSSCDSACSELLSNYILTVFNGPAGDPNETPNSEPDPEPNNDPNNEPNTGSNQDPIALYNQLCATCHGDTGQGTAIAPSLIDCVTCSDADVLARTINFTMPQGNSSSCDNACSELISNYILTAFNEPAGNPNEEPNNDPDPEPNNDSNIEPNTGSNDDPIALYDQLCATCHGDTGQGTAIAPTLINCENCYDAYTLARKIRTTMPPGNERNCRRSCPELLSNYILTVFNDPANIPNQDPNADPNSDPNTDPNSDPNTDPNSDPNTEPNTGSNEDPIVLYDQLCATCHGDTGQGTDIAPSLIACANCGAASILANYIKDTMPLGNIGSCDLSCAQGLSELILTEFNESNDELSADTVGFIRILSTMDTVRKAAMKLVSRFPSVEEFQLAATDVENGLPLVIENMMEEDAFYNRLSELFNDYILTDKYLSTNGTEAAIGLLDRNDFPNRRWFDPDSGSRPENYEFLRRATNDGIAREPLELINYIVANDRPFTEIVTADYFMVNPFSARSYGVDNVAFDTEDPNEFQPAQLANLPHAGILTSTMFLNRYPTTNTNRNRARSRVVFDLFLDTDILAIEGVRPGNSVDITTPIPTMNNPECAKCHTIMDPVASVFQNWDQRGRYRPTSSWYTDMLPSGFNGLEMPLSGNTDSSVQWLAQQIAVDPKFPRAVMRIVIKGLTGKEPLTAQGAETEAYIAERTVLDNIQDSFVADNYNLKILIREILMSPYWRADGLTAEANVQSHATTGSQQLLTPEQLDRKIEAMLGFQWRDRMDDYYRDIENSRESKLGYKFHQIYGGIDSDSVTTRLTSPNGLMGAMQLRMANELACYAVPQEFMSSADQRMLFPFVNADTIPLDASGSIDPQAMQLIRQNIQFLHDYLLAEYFPLQQGELQITEDLFMTTFNMGQLEIENQSATSLPSYCQRSRDIEGNPLYPDGGEDNRVLRDPDYVMRSWMAVLAYLLSDYRFVYE